jgi:hypothetical protein
MGHLVGAAQNDVAFDPSAPIGANADGAPDCAVNPAINKNATTFVFQPEGCTPGATCQSVRTVVISLENVDPIPDGSVLYDCAVSISLDAALGHYYPLVCSTAGASDLEGNPLATSCADGDVVAAVACNGDCNGNDQVTIDELIKGVNIALGNLLVANCPAFDANVDGVVTIDELLKAVNRAQNGCS